VVKTVIAGALAAVIPAATPANALAEQAGVAFWFSGQFANVVTIPATLGCDFQVDCRPS
jgi:hypothetical protein